MPRDGRDEIVERYLEATRQLIASGVADLAEEKRIAVLAVASAGLARMRVTMDLPRDEYDDTQIRVTLVARDGTETEVFAVILPPT